MRMASCAISFARELRVFGEHPGRGERVGSPGTDCADAIIGLDYIAVPGNQECGLGVRNNQQRFEMAQRAILAPFLGQLDGGLRKIALVFLELPFKALEKGKRVGR